MFLIAMALIACMLGSFIQSRLSSLNTVLYRTSIDSVEDLMESNTSIYGQSNYFNMIYDQTLRKRYHVIKTLEDCSNRLKKGARLICVHSNERLRYYLQEDELIHISKENLLRVGLTYMHAEDLPLMRRMNWILSRLSKGGFINLFYERDKLYYARTPRDGDFEKSLRMANLRTEFYVLLGGWALAMFVFLIASVTYTIKKCSYKKSRKFLWNKIRRLKEILSNNFIATVAFFRKKH